MKTGLLMSAARVAVGVAVGVMAVGAVDVQAACIPTNDCAALGYKYSAADCGGEGLACPFDTTRYNCANPCTYTISANTCSSQCLNVGTKSCTKNGVTYYESCGASKCSSGQTCSNGTCVSPVAKSGYCCGYINDCGYSGGTSSSYDSECQSHYGRTCYNQCKFYGYLDCTDMQANCRASGGSPVFQPRYCINFSSHALFSCE